jgi:curved DNA-binding protein CbpA
MKTLYDLLGARPDDDADALRAAFRKAAKAHHPDLHAGDPYAAIRFRQIAQAYEILRDAEQRATYDRVLRFEREQTRWKLKRTVSYLMRSIVSDAVTAVGLAVVLAGGYTIFAHLSKTPAEQLLGTTAGHGSARIAAVQPAPPNTNNRDELRDGLERAGGRAPEAATAGSAAKAAGLNTDVAEIANAFAVIMDRAGPKTAAEPPGQNVGTETPDRNGAPSVDVLSSSVERDDGAAKSSSPDFAMADDKRDMKGRDIHEINTSDVKTSDTKMHARPRIAAKRQAASHTTFEQASLENKSSCVGSCSRDVPPLFGVGF